MEMMKRMIIDRKLFYKVLQNSKNLSYVEEIKGFTKSKSPINLSEVMKRLDLFDIISLMEATGNLDVVKFIKDTWISNSNDLDVSWEGFDCYYPFYMRRDYLIKQFIKTRGNENIKFYGLKLEDDRTEKLLLLVNH